MKIIQLFNWKKQVWGRKIESEVTTCHPSRETTALFNLFNCNCIYGCDVTLITYLKISWVFASLMGKYIHKQSTNTQSFSRTADAWVLSLSQMFFMHFLIGGNFCFFFFFVNCSSATFPGFVHHHRIELLCNEDPMFLLLRSLPNAVELPSQKQRRML